MSLKKHRKMTLSAALNIEMEQSSQFLTVFGGLFLLIAAISVRMVCGAPYQMMLQLGISDLIPPVWIMTFLCFASFFLIGAAAGLVLGYRRESVQTEKYKGCLLFVLLAMVELSWYPTLFIKGLVFMSVLEALMMLFLAICVTVSFLKVSRFSGTVLIFHDLFLMYLVVLSFAILFRN